MERAVPFSSTGPGHVSRKTSGLLSIHLDLLLSPLLLLLLLPLLPPGDDAGAKVEKKKPTDGTPRRGWERRRELGKCGHAPAPIDLGRDDIPVEQNDNTQRRGTAAFESEHPEGEAVAGGTSEGDRGHYG